MFASPLPRGCSAPLRSAPAGGAGGQPCTTGRWGSQRHLPGHGIYRRVDDDVNAAAARHYGVGVWTDPRGAAVCQAVPRYRRASLATGERVLPAPWPHGWRPAASVKRTLN